MRILTLVRSLTVVDTEITLADSYCSDGETGRLKIASPPHEPQESEISTT